jgi:hypothetical protein
MSVQFVPVCPAFLSVCLFVSLSFGISVGVSGCLPADAWSPVCLSACLPAYFQCLKGVIAPCLVSVLSFFLLPACSLKGKIVQVDQTGAG